MVVFVPFCFSADRVVFQAASVLAKILWQYLQTMEPALDTRSCLRGVDENRYGSTVVGLDIALASPKIVLSSGSWSFRFFSKGVENLVVIVRNQTIKTKKSIQKVCATVTYLTYHT